MLKYICAKKIRQKVLKNAKNAKNTQKMIEIIFNFYEFVVSLKHCDSI
jgi:hypothetical protein